MAGGSRSTDKKLREMERHVSAIYDRAGKEIAEKAEKFFSRFTEQDNAKRKLVESGQLTEKEYKSWRMTKIVTEQGHLTAMKEQISRELLEANRTAQAYINNNLPDVYASNYNITSKGVSDVVKGYTFELVDASTVKNLATKDDTLLPYKYIDGRKDVRWNTQKVNSEIMQGIVQGESIPDIAARLQNVTEMNRASSIRNARTTVTSAENKGRMDSLHAAQEKGVTVKKVWTAAIDSRTRDAHMELDGQEADIDEPFVNEYGPIMYPGDPDADPANVYNCRCTLTYKVGEDAIAQDSDTEEVLEENVPEEEQNQEQSVPFESAQLKSALTDDQYNEFKGLVDNAPTKDLYDKYADSCNGIESMSSGGSYRPYDDTVHFSMSTDEGTSEYSTLAHEMSHMFDAHIGQADGLSFNEAGTINDACRFGSGVNTLLKTGPSSSDGFLSALRDDMNNLKPGLAGGRSGTLAQELLSSQTMRNATAGIQDALDGFFGTQDKGILPWGHGNRYYNRSYNQKVVGFGLDKKLKQAMTDLGMDASSQAKVKTIMRQYEAASEAWANVGSAITCGGPELEAMEKYMPNTVKEYLRICEVIK